MTQQEVDKSIISNNRIIPLPVKAVLLIIILYIGFADIIGDQFNHLYYEPPEAWLAHSVGPEAIKDNLTLYIKDPWGQSVYSVMSIKQDVVYIVWPRKNIFHVYNFKPIVVPSDSCKELKPLIHTLKELISGSPIDDAIAEGARNKGIGLDGPTFTLVKLDGTGTAVQRWDSNSDSLEAHLAFEINEQAKTCQSKEK